MIGKQTTTVKISANVLVGTNVTPWTAYNSGVDFSAFNATFFMQAEFLGAEKIQTLSGYEKQGIMGFRPMATIDLRNTTRAETQKIQTLLGYAGTWASGNRPLFPGAGGATLGRNVPTIFGISTGGTTATYQYYNLTTSIMNITRELSVNSQVITLNFSGINIVNTIPDGFIV
jgi:hypothetical protein